MSPLASSEQRRIAVRLLVWGTTDQHADAATCRAGEGDSRRTWDFVDVERLAGSDCPINVLDPKVIAADAGAGWAYAVYRAGT